MKTHFKAYEDLLFFTVEAETDEDRAFLQLLDGYSKIELIADYDTVEFKVFVNRQLCPVCKKLTEDLLSYAGQLMCDMCVIERNEIDDEDWKISEEDN